METTVLKVVNDILSDMDSDVVTAIDDTVEAEQVATILKNQYNRMIATEMLKVDPYFTQLDISGSNVYSITIPYDAVVYDVRYVNNGVSPARVNKINYVSPIDFISKGLDAQLVSGVTSQEDLWRYQSHLDVPTEYTIMEQDESEDNVTKIQLAGTGLVGDSIQYSYSYQFTRMTDTPVAATPVILPEDLYSLLYNQVKSICYADLQQQVSPKTEKLLREDKVSAAKSRFDKNFRQGQYYTHVKGR